MSSTAGEKVNNRTPVQGGLILIFVAILIIGFVYMSRVLNVGSLWPGFLFFTCWAGVEQAKIEKLVPVTVGALVGVLISFLTLYINQNVAGELGALAAFAVILVVIYLQVMGWMLMAINLATTVFLTVSTIPIVRSTASLTEIIVSLALGVLIFGGSCVAGELLERKMKSPSS